MKSIVALPMLLSFASAGLAQGADWQKIWDETLVAAKKEGKIVVVGSPHPEMRNEVIPKFAADVFMVGASTALNALYADKMIDPLSALLLTPEVTDGAKWKTGKPPFIDPEGRYILRLFSTIDSLVFINTDYVKPAEMRSVEDLLKPKWKGKISTEDPGIDSGSGGNKAANFYNQLANFDAEE